MKNPANLDALFQQAVSAIDAGNLEELQRLLEANQELASARLDSPGAWLRAKVGGALNGFFKKPYLLWFVAEDPVRNGKLPRNIAQMAGAIIEAAKRKGVASLQVQLDYALRLVGWSWIARECGVQIELIDMLVDAGASPDGISDDALVNGNTAAAEHLIERGAKLTLPTALCLGRWADAKQLGPHANAQQKQMGLVLAALNGKAEAVALALQLGADANRPSAELYSHGTPLHHAVCSGSLETVKVLVKAGAKLEMKDKAWKGTPLGWAEHYVNEHAKDERAKTYAEIAEYLRNAAAGK